MAERIITLREQAAEFRRLAGTFSSLETRDRLEALAMQCERLADDIENPGRKGPGNGPWLTPASRLSSPANDRGPDPAPGSPASRSS